VRRAVVALVALAVFAPSASAAVRVRAEIPPGATTGDAVRVRGSVSHRATVALQR